MCEITRQAKCQLAALGLDQWQKGYPSREVWERDIQEQTGYVAIENGLVIGCMAYLSDPDPSYAQIDGAWLTGGDVAYGSMHRVCVADGARGKGVAGRLFSYGFMLAAEQGLPSVRIDTHPGNKPMQRALAKAGFEPCGRIWLVSGEEAGDERIAYERLLK